jgi:hypothetical protein
MPPFFQHFGEFRFGDAVTLVSFDQHFSADAAMTQDSGDTLCDCATIAESLMR